MNIYNVGPHELEEWDLSYLSGFKWVIYHYEQGGYDGYGELLAYDENKDIFYFYDLSHCSCYGPLEGKGGIQLTTEELFRPSDSIHDLEIKEEILQKAMFLLG